MIINDFSSFQIIKQTSIQQIQIQLGSNATHIFVFTGEKNISCNVINFPKLQDLPIHNCIIHSVFLSLHSIISVLFSLVTGFFLFILIVELKKLVIFKSIHIEKLVVFWAEYLIGLNSFLIVCLGCFEINHICWRWIPGLLA